MKGTPERVIESRAMRRYRVGWNVVVVLLVAVGMLAGSISIGWAPLVGITVCLAVLGAAFGVAWVEPDGDRRAASMVGARYGAAGALMVAGLPAIIEGWTALVLIAVTLTAPPILELVVRTLHGKHCDGAVDDPTRLSERDLAERWRASYDEVHRADASAIELLEVVAERARLLDELERRDPRRFRAWLAETAETRPGPRPGAQPGSPPGPPGREAGPGSRGDRRTQHLEAVAWADLVPPPDLLGHRPALALAGEPHRRGRDPHLVVQPQQAAGDRERDEPDRPVTTDAEGVREAAWEVHEPARGQLEGVLAGDVGHLAVEQVERLGLVLVPVQGSGDPRRLGHQRHPQPTGGVLRPDEVLEERAHRPGAATAVGCARDDGVLLGVVLDVRLGLGHGDHLN